MADKKYYCVKSKYSADLPESCIWVEGWCGTDKDGAEKFAKECEAKLKMRGYSNAVSWVEEDK